SREQESYGCETLLPIDEEPPSNTGGCFFSFGVDHGSNKMGFGIARTYPLGSCKFATDVKFDLMTVAQSDRSPVSRRPLEAHDRAHAGGPRLGARLALCGSTLFQRRALIPWDAPANPPRARPT